MDTTTVSDLEIRATLEDFGIVKPPRLPKLEALMVAVRERKGSVAISEGDRGATATVILSGEEHQGHGDTPARAVAVALTKALLAEPQQTSFFGGDGTLTDEMRERLKEIRAKRIVKPEEDVDPETGEIN